MAVRIPQHIGLVSLAVVAMLGAGCASTKQLDEVRAIAEEAQRTAAEAKAIADAAAADAAQANQRAAMTDEKIDRMFKQSMMK